MPDPLVPSDALGTGEKYQYALDGQRANRLPMMLSAAKWLLDCNDCYRAPGVVHERLTSQALMHHGRPVHQSLW